MLMRNVMSKTKILTKQVQAIELKEKQKKKKKRQAKSWKIFK